MSPRKQLHPFAPGVIVRCRPVPRVARVPRGVWLVGAVMALALTAAALGALA